jgi:hypothetical protein
MQYLKRTARFIGSLALILILWLVLQVFLVVLMFFYVPFVPEEEIYNRSSLRGSFVYYYFSPENDTCKGKPAPLKTKEQVLEWAQKSDYVIRRPSYKTGKLEDYLHNYKNWKIEFRPNVLPFGPWYIYYTVIFEEKDYSAMIEVDTCAYVIDSLDKSPNSEDEANSKK